VWCHQVCILSGPYQDLPRLCLPVEVFTFQLDSGGQIWTVAPGWPGSYNPRCCTANRGPNGTRHWKESSMTWTKPEFTVVAVTLEVTAYAGKK
jgi:coenzyme PQQ precursor peptide PqqA